MRQRMPPSAPPFLEIPPHISPPPPPTASTDICLPSPPQLTRANSDRRRRLPPSTRRSRQAATATRARGERRCPQLAFSDDGDVCQRREAPAVRGGVSPPALACVASLTRQRRPDKA